MVLAGCGGSSSSSPSGSKSDYTKATNDVAGKVQRIADDISSTAASGSTANDAAAWKALADRAKAAAGELSAGKAPTPESRGPLAKLVTDIGKLERDVRAVADAGGVNAAGSATLSALSDDGTAITGDLEQLPLY